MSHALAEFGKGHLISFYSNCSGTRGEGHNGFGWLEYRRSYDSGKTWDEAKVFPYSWDSFLNQPFTVSCEKSVSAAENEIVAFCIRNTNPNGWEPYLEPVVVRSEDGGETWSDAVLMCGRKGRIYDALVRDGSIYVLMFANDMWEGMSPEHRYYIYRSDDHGKTFTEHSELPGETFGKAYGNMVIRDDSSLVCYIYNSQDEYNMDYYISPDMGLTWTESGKSFCPKRIRNPQVAKVRGGYLLHGRSGCTGDELVFPRRLVLYTSKDAITWDEGEFLCDIQLGAAYYSNNLVLNRDDGNQRVLIQSSVAYERYRCNICHWWLDIV